ncbi:hypothetical protein DUNSADRAFT_2873 [Dunaliella salina]|uniref:Secreted protein n=1 Tax=Dunaliella salina TaxID=3046 RepID=A0ABQ7FVV4_DUNSA|nr:hypothetical protein DUNSADRAFT_2873 [Dunaliella salina]|eukprot:KAF5826505.1 hypothetical protein DUNSADRAFT_2873 [Dunaliella salina]
MFDSLQCLPARAASSLIGGCTSASASRCITLLWPAWQAPCCLASLPSSDPSLSSDVGLTLPVKLSAGVLVAVRTNPPSEGSGSFLPSCCEASCLSRRSRSNKLLGSSAAALGLPGNREDKM